MNKKYYGIIGGNNIVYVYGYIDDAGVWQGTLYTAKNEDIRAAIRSTGKPPETLKEIAVPAEFDGCGAHYKHELRDGVIHLTEYTDEHAQKLAEQEIKKQSNAALITLIDSDYIIIKCAEQIVENYISRSTPETYNLPYDAAQLTRIISDRRAAREKVVK